MADISEVRNGLFMFDDGDTINLRALRHSADGMLSKFHDSKEKLAQVVAKNDHDEDLKALFVQLQHINPDVLADIADGSGVRAHHIDRYRWLLLDIDTLRENKSKSNATDAEKAGSWEVVKAIYQFLRERGWPKGIVCDSGNGWHILFRIDLPNSTQNYELLERCLKAVAHRFNNEDAEVDISTADPAQLTKLYGSTVRKAPENTADRPWRASRVLKVPEVIEVVGLELLESLAGLCPAMKKPEHRRNMPELHEDFDIYDFAEFYELDIADEFEKQGETYYVLSECPNVERQHSGDANKSCIIIGQTLGFHCFSDECTDFRIGDLLRKLAQEHGRYPHPIYADIEFTGVEVEDCDVSDAGSTDGPPQCTPRNPEAEAPEPAVGDPSGNSGTGAAKTGKPELEHEGTSEKTAGDNGDTATADHDDLDLVQKLAAIIFRDPKSQYLDFAIYRGRLLKVARRKAWPKHYAPLLKGILEFEAEHRKLPSRSELLDAHKDDPEMVSVIDPIGVIAADLTIDYVCQKIIAKARLLDDLRTADTWLKKLKDSKNVDKGRAFVKTQFGESITTMEVRSNSGSVQDHAADIHERFRKMAEGDTSDTSPLRFKTMFPAIDESINTELERCFALIGPANNFKTSILLTEVYNLAKQGFPVLLVTGEHDVVI